MVMSWTAITCYCQVPPSSTQPEIIKITGKIINDKGEPLANANVTVKKNGRGTITNARGIFELGNIGRNDVLQVSFIGYETKDIRIGTQSDLVIVLLPASNELDKVVVQAYGQTSKRLATGNIGVIKAADISKQPVMNVIQAIQGQVPGVVMTNTSGYASSTVRIEIRGRNIISPNFPSDPLYIIDGVPLTILDLYGSDDYATGSKGFIQSGIPSPADGQSPFFSINPSDIESIEILKDADATAIYGSRASNGVILITTKKGSAGKSRFELNLYHGIANTPRYYRLLNTQQYVAMRREALANDGLPLNINTAPDIVGWDTLAYTDWQKFLWGGLGKTTDIQGNFSGGDPRTSFRFGASYHHQTDILSYSGANQRGSLSFNINHKSANQKMNLSFTNEYAYTFSDLIYVPGSITIPPNAPPVWDEKGNLNFAGWAPLSGSFPFAALLQPYSSKTRFLNASMILGYEIAKGLIVKTTLGYNNTQADQTYLKTIASQNPAYNPTGRSSLGYSYVSNITAEPQVEWNRFIGKGRMTLLGGASVQSNTTSSVLLSGYGYIIDDLLTSVGNAPSQSSNNMRGEYKYAALFSRFTYNWRDKYILNLNGRRDGSSRFGPGRQYGNFGSLGFAWIFAGEDWVKEHLPFLSSGKLRGSYGTTGGDQIGDYQFLSRWSYTRFTYNGTLPLTPVGHTDSLLHWQVNRKSEIALEMGFLQDRIGFQLAWYRNRCNNQLVFFPTPLFTGFNNVTSNSPADVENQGIEIDLNARILDKGEFKWSVKYNIGINRNKLIAYPNLSQSPYKDIFIIGKSLNIRRVLHYTGVDPSTGHYTFEDKNKDGQISLDFTDKTPDDRYPIDLSPQFDGGFTSNFSYHGLDLSLFFYFRKQRGVNSLTALTAPGDNYNQPVEVLDRWQSPGQITQIARFTTNPFVDRTFTNYQSYSDAVYTDASFVRLQNLAVSYTIPEKITRKAGLLQARIYFQCENLFILTKYKGLDPEVQSFSSLPVPRILTGGLSVNF
jgi:TonB-linked SusC/RagA family outer membrane protein